MPGCPVSPCAVKECAQRWLGGIFFTDWKAAQHSTPVPHGGDTEFHLERELCWTDSRTLVLMKALQVPGPDDKLISTFVSRLYPDFDWALSASSDRCIPRLALAS